MDCKMIRDKTEGQVIGDLPTFRSKISPVFSCVDLDSFGPREVKEDIIQRGPKRLGRIWGVTFTCMATRAVYIGVSIDYNTLLVLHTVQRLIAYRGEVSLIYSDPGTQIVGVSRELCNWRNGWSHEELTTFGLEKQL